MTHKYSVVVQETVTFRVTVEAADVVSAMRAARKARAKGKGVRTSKTPWQAMPSVTRLPDEGSHTAVIGPMGSGKTPVGACPVTGLCSKPCPTGEACAHVAAQTASVSPHTAPGRYVCASPKCAYGFELRADGIWVGPYYPDERPSRPKAMTWATLEEWFGDCAGRLQRV
jgi:hypothetical protein